MNPILLKDSEKILKYKLCLTEFDSTEFNQIASADYGEAIYKAIVKKSDRLTDKDLILINKEFTNKKFTDGGSHNILDAYYYFHTIAMDYIHRDEDKNWKDELEDLFVNIKTYLKVILTTIDTSDHPEKIFESINATGRKLSEFDYLRNNLFLRSRQIDSDQEGGEYDSDNFYERFWRLKTVLVTGQQKN